MQNIFPPIAITICLIGMIAFPSLLPTLEKHASKKILIGLIALWILTSAYCLAAGIHLLNGWDVEVTQEQRGKAAEHRRGGLLLMVIEYWPYILIALGSIFAFVGFVRFKGEITSLIHENGAREER